MRKYSFEAPHSHTNLRHGGRALQAEHRLAVFLALLPPQLTHRRQRALRVHNRRLDLGVAQLLQRHGVSRVHKFPRCERGRILEGRVLPVPSLTNRLNLASPGFTTALYVICIGHMVQ